MPTLRDERPLIVTARLDHDSFTILNEMRRRHFPATLNKVPAHVSLFHNLPGVSMARIVENAVVRCGEHVPFDLKPLGLRALGRGVAIAYEGGSLQMLHTTLAHDWAGWLTAQDRHPFKPHVTIQNKVEPETARSLFGAMRNDKLPVCRIEGIMIWRYLGGPWEAVMTCPFAA